MRIIRHKKFTKHYKKLDSYLREKVDSSIEKFYKNPFDPSLRNHPLHGNMYGKRSISVTGDIRIVFEEHDNYILVIMLDIGSHNQVY